MSSGFGKRFKDLFGKATNAEIAEQLGYKEDAVSNYARGRIPDGNKLAHISKMTNCNLHWLLTGEGEMYISQMKTAPSLINEDLFAEKVRSIVQEELEKKEFLFTDYDIEDSEDIQDLGDADGYDFEKAIDENKSPAEIFREYFVFHGKEVTANHTLNFKGWNEMSKEMKLAEIKNVAETQIILEELDARVKREWEEKRQKLMKEGNLRRYKRRR